MSVAEICAWLEASAVGVLVRESLWGFPIVVAVHILGLVFSAGTILWLDLRLLGLVMLTRPASAVTRSLLPWAIAGFAVMFVSGGMLFAGFATAAYENTYFRLKVVAMLLAAVNAFVYHVVTERRIDAWDTAARPPAVARLAGLASLVLWTSVIIAGRLMSYTMF